MGEAAKLLHQGRHLANRGIVPARHDGERAGPRRVGAARHRRIDEGHAGAGRENLGLGLGGLDLGGGVIHQHLAVEPPGRDDAVQARDDIFDRGRVDDADQHDVGLLRDLGRRRRRLDAVALALRDLGGVDVEANDAMADLLEAGA